MKNVEKYLLLLIFSFFTFMGVSNAEAVKESISLSPGQTSVFISGTLYSGVKCDIDNAVNSGHFVFFEESGDFKVQLKNQDYSGVENVYAKINCTYEKKFISYKWICSR